MTSVKVEKQPSQLKEKAIQEQTVSSSCDVTTVLKRAPSDSKFVKPPKMTLAKGSREQTPKKRLGRPTKKVNRVLSPKSIAVDNTNHKLTEYFQVRRSIRKSKKQVLEQKQRDLENKVLDECEDGLEVKVFPGKGRGVVTTQEFKKGEFVIEYVGELIDMTTAKKREALYSQDQNTGCYMYYFQHQNQQHCVDATAESNKLGRLVNHSRNGNLVTRIVDVKSKPHLVLIAKEDIPAGVELSYDYGDRSKESLRHHPWLAL